MNFAPPQPETIGPEDLQEAISIVDMAMREGSDQTFLTDYPLVYRDANLKNIHVCRHAGHIVAEVPYIPRHVAHAGCNFRIGIISPTATHPDFRRQGYGIANVHAAVRQMTRECVHVSVLWTALPTFAFYQHAGYQGVREQMKIYPIFRDDAAIFDDGGHRVQQLDPTITEHLEQVVALHRAEPAGVYRADDEYVPLLTLPKMVTHLAFSQDKVKAYLIESHASNKPGLIEGAGESDALATLMRHVLRSLPDDAPILGYGYLASSSLGDLLESVLQERRRPWGEEAMMRINLVRPFFNAIAPWLAKQSRDRHMTFSIEVVDANETISFDLDDGRVNLGDTTCDNHHQLTRRELTAAVFGENLAQRVAVPEPMRRIFPFYFPIWELDHS